MSTRLLLATVATFGVLAAGCTNAAADAAGQASPALASPTPSSPSSCSPTRYDHGKSCAEISDFDNWFKVGWVDVSGHVPFKQSPDGQACEVPWLLVAEGPPDLADFTDTTVFTVTPVYEKYRWGEHREHEDVQQSGVAFTGADNIKYIAHFDSNGTLWHFARGSSLVFRPCPAWAQG
jgi:hypothetical protein